MVLLEKFVGQSPDELLRPRALRIVFSALALCGCALFATGARAQPVTVKDAWVRAPAPGQKVAAAYMELVSRGNMMLLAVTSPVAAAVELHNTTVEGGVVKMRPVSRVELPAGRAVKLAPGGLHVMLSDLKQPLIPGDKVPLTLTVQRTDFGARATFTIQAEVRSAGVERAHQH